MTFVLRPIEGFSQPDYSVIWKRDDGTEKDIGRIYHSVCVSSDPTTQWRWSVYGQTRGGLAASLDEAKAAFRRCWGSFRAVAGP
jgi:hypothetical protein